MKHIWAIVFMVSPLSAVNCPIYVHSESSIQEEFRQLCSSINSALESRTGSTDESNACEGCIGEVKDSIISSPTPFPSSGQFGDLTSITLSAGDWEISLSAGAQDNGATVTLVGFGIGSSSGNTSTGLVEGSSYGETAPPTPTYHSHISIPSYRQNTTSSQTYYLKYRANYSVATPQAFGRISARRMR